MNFSRRLRLFVFGILLGSFVVWAMLIRGRNFPAWTPEGRILESLSQHPVSILPLAGCKMKCNGISNNDMLNLINTADVLFKESDIRGKEIPEYVLSGSLMDGRIFKMKFKSEPEQNYLLDVLTGVDAKTLCNCR
jgi:hypothetical protein